GGFARAAERLRLHRPAVTKAVQHLEAELGVQLLHRTTRKLSVTAEGAIFHERCRNVLADVADTLATFSPTRPPKGPVRVDVPISLAKAVIIPALPGFCERYPEVELTLRSSDHQVDLVGEGVDCAVRIGTLEDSGLSVRRIGTVPMLTCAAPAYLARHGKPTGLENLDGHLAVNFLIRHTRRTMDWNFLIDGRTVARSLRSGIVVDDTEAMVTGAIAGLGLIQAPRPSLQPHVNAGTLVEILPDLATVPKPISLLSTDRRFAVPAVKAFVEWVQGLLRDEGRTGLLSERKR
ncbi:transcriptional regulator, partial [Methylobacterium sp. Leaf119]